MEQEALTERAHCLFSNLGKTTRVADQVEHPGAGSVAALDLLHLELFRPRNNGTPDELVEQNNDGNHGGDAPEDGSCVARAGRGLEIRTQAGKAEVARA